MKTFKLLPMLIVLTFIQGTSLYTQEDQGSPGNKILLLDDFDAGRERNLLGGGTQGDEEFPGGCIPSFVSDASIVFGHGGKSLQLDYDVLEPNSFSYYWSKTGPDGTEPGSSTHLDLQDYQYLSFWVKSGEMAPRFHVEIHQDKDNDQFFVIGKDVVAKIPATRFLRTEEVEEWRKIVFPFSSFRQIEDWSKVIEVVFVFENKNRSKKGILYVDDILFGSTDSENPNLLEPVEKKDVFGYFKIHGVKTDESFSLHPQNDLELFLKAIPKHLERVYFEASWDGGRTWTTLKNFYDHTPGIGYRYLWVPDPSETGGNVLLRACVSNIIGQTTVVSGPLEARG